MRVTEHQPPEDVHLTDAERAVFLAGPIQGAQDWQSGAIEIFRELPAKIEELHVFNPRRDGEFDLSQYQEQIYWEQDHIALTANHGALVFWMEPQDPSISYPVGREYAKTTKKELGMAVGQLLLGNSISVSFGIDPDYEDTERYFRTTFDRLGLPVHTSLATTCEDAWLQLHR